MNRETDPSKHAHLPTEEQLQQLLDPILERIAHSPDLQQFVVYKLLSSLFGEHFQKERWIYDPQGEIYAHVLSPEKRFQLQLLEDPAFAAELDRRSTTNEPTVPFKDVLQRLKPMGK